MCPSNDPHLDIEIQMCEQRLKLLKELRNRRKTDKLFTKVIHEPNKVNRGKKGQGIVSIVCTCGENIKYRVALQDLGDFQCPQNRG